MIVTVDLTEPERRELLTLGVPSNTNGDGIRYVPWDRANALVKLREALDRAARE
jgi:hypothetical protein